MAIMMFTSEYSCEKSWASCLGNRTVPPHGMTLPEQFGNDVSEGYRD
mgnify:CR=1 FL=1